MLSILELLRSREALSVTPQYQEEQLKAYSQEIQYQQHEQMVSQLLELQHRQKQVSMSAALAAVMSLCLSLVELEDNYQINLSKARNQSSAYGTGLRTVVSVLTGILLVTVVWHYRLEYRRMRVKQQATGPRFMLSPQYRWMWTELVLFAVHCPPGVDVDFHFSQLHGTLILSFDEIATVLMFLRLSLLFRCIRCCSVWGSLSVSNACGQYGCSAGQLFMLKSYFQQRPFTVLSLCLVSSLVTFGLMVRIFERPYAFDNDTGQDYDYIWNSLWLVVITMFTVGYGDFYPQTHLGRTVIVVACIWGMFLISMLVVEMARLTVHSKQEEGAYTLISRLHRHRKMKKAAANAVFQCFKYSRFAKTDMKKPALARLMEAVADYQQAKADSQVTQTSVRDTLNLFEENVTIDLQELRRLSIMFVDINEQLRSVETVQKQIRDSLEDGLIHTRAVLKEVDGSEVIYPEEE